MFKTPTTLDDLHEDALRQIFIRIARPPNGAADLARAFSICKGFNKFSQDKDVLKAVVFDNLLVSRRCEPFSPDEVYFRSSPGFDHLSICSKYVSYQHLDGLIIKCAQAGHPDAQLILAKIIMVTASDELFNAKNEAERSEVSVEDVISTKHAEASSFLAHFSAEKIGNLRHFDLVRMFLSRATYIELEDMRPYLKDFVSYFVSPGVQYHHQRFLYVVEELWASRYMLLDSTRLFILVGMCNDICLRGYNILLTLGANQQLLDSLQLLVLPKEHFEITYESMVEHSAEIEAIIQQGIEEAVAQGKVISEEDARIIEGSIGDKNALTQHNILAELVEKLRANIIDDFDVMFPCLEHVSET